nr:MAG TPA: hypothetical protein [Caudoviricetes sp.]
MRKENLKTMYYKARRRQILRLNALKTSQHPYIGR